ncbi:MAG TPA: GNAT family N-acetyltransferase [Bryobacteraceae bacterium]|nr:GNAT family N-acetyltransferase [Bryobacteraceae bacterium]
MAAARSDRQSDSLVSVHELTGHQISALLEEEISEWRRSLDWDFAASAELVRRFVEMRALTGFALMDSTGVTGYSYYVVEEGKGLIGDLYVRAAQRTTERENLLLATVLDALWRTPGTTRVEAQLLMLGMSLGTGRPGTGGPGTTVAAAARPMPFAQWLRSYPRLFLEAPLAAAPRTQAVNLPPRQVPDAVILPWSERRQQEAAATLAAAYRGHIDSQINDQYRSAAGAGRFLTNIVQFPGCGSFFAPASYVAEDRNTGILCGLCLASIVADGVGHITQVCVDPEHRATGLGYELLRRSLLSLAASGCRTVSLTVTGANQSAVRLYERMGFRTRRNFSAFVWEKPV